MQTVTLSDETIHHLQEAATRRGLEADVYAEELLSISLAVLRDASAAPSGKPYRAMKFSGVSPTGRPAGEIDTEIAEGRAEWDEDAAAAASAAPQHSSHEANGAA